MLHTGKWQAEVFLFEQGGQTRADAVLDTGTNKLHGYGAARHHADDAEFPEILDELAAGRALTDLGRKLIGTAADDLVGALGRPEHPER